MKRTYMTIACFILAICMFLTVMAVKEVNLKTVYECQTINYDTPYVSEIYVANINTELCTTEMLGVCNVVYLSNHSKRGQNDTVSRVSALILNLQDYLQNISDMYSRLHWEVSQEMHTDIFILDFIHRQDGEK
ncbi:MAG: hypothetical protein IJX12_04575 [Lachnospiraceae bacterium]|nr:hypothetical protein [Lachnospiraceae bacterium]